MPKQLMEIAPYVLGLAGAGVALFLLMEMRRLQEEYQRRWNRRQQSLASELGSLRGIVEEMRGRLVEFEQGQATGAAGANGGKLVSVNMNRRAQAMRLFRRGEGWKEVGKTLGFRQGEAELLWKVHRILANQALGGRGEEAGLPVGGKPAAWSQN